MTLPIRVGIDVGGTFTHAVAVDNRTLEVLAHAVTPTSHAAQEGVARGILEVFEKLLASLEGDYRVVFLAHSTTQATNALLEGDVARVGILGLGSGLEGAKARADMTLPPIELAPGKLLENRLAFVDPSAGPEAVQAALEAFRAQGVEAVVAAQAFSVDDPEGEQGVMRQALDLGLPSCGTHEMTGLYGLRVRTRTAVLNASILPRMVETARMTQRSVESLSIPASMMIMRSDGGVMTLDEVHRRPVLTLLSGPAAGIAAALMYLRAADALFLEVGGTSTDICMIKDGRASLQSAVIGGNPTYLRTLDSRTLGIAGGSMVGPGNDAGSLIVGPRSAHLAGLRYSAYATAEELAGPLTVVEVRPVPGDPPYYALQVASGERFAITTTCAACFLGYIKPGDYAYSSTGVTSLVFAALAAHRGTTAEAVAREILAQAAARIVPTLKALIEEYRVADRQLKLLGGGGGAGAIVPFVAEVMGLQCEIAPRAEVISAIGAALAMVREVLERSILNPSQADLAALRAEAERAVLRMGADPGTIQVTVEIDAQKSLVRATAVGSVEFVAGDVLAQEIPPEERLLRLEQASPRDGERALVGTTGALHLYETRGTEKVLLFFKRSRRTLWVLDGRGDVRLQVPGGLLEVSTGERLHSDLETVLSRHMTYTDAGARIPPLLVVCGPRIVDLSALQAAEQVTGLLRAELPNVAPADPVFFVVRPQA